MDGKKLSWIKKLWLRLMGRRFIGYKHLSGGGVVITEAYWVDETITIAKQTFL